MPALKCPYCERDAELATGAVIYPRRPDLDHKLFWRCQPCDAYIGCHPGTSTPMGRMANADLRQAKQNAHAWFDRIWMSREMSRKKAYRWLADELGIEAKNAHIGMFDLDRCRLAVQACQARKKVVRC